jgi:hypothetical protein
LIYAQKERRLGATPNTQPDEEKDVSGPVGPNLPARQANSIVKKEQFLCHSLSPIGPKPVSERENRGGF